MKAAVHERQRLSETGGGTERCKLFPENTDTSIYLLRSCSTVHVSL